MGDLLLDCDVIELGSLGGDRKEGHFAMWYLKNRLLTSTLF